MSASWILVFGQAAVRALVAAVAVAGVLRLLRVTNVVAEKAAWALVLVAALALPLVPAEFRLPAAVEARATNLAAQAWAGARHWAAQTLAERWPERFENRRRAAATPAVAAPAAAAPKAGQQPAAVVGSVENLAAPEVVYEFDTSYPAETVAVQPVQPTSTAAKPAPRQLPTWIKLAALCLYLAVAAALLLRLMVGLVTALRLWFQSHPVESEATAGIRVRASERIASPVTVGSAVLLPAGYLDWSPKKLRVVLAHEQSHIRQGDFYLQLAASIYAALVWPSPLGWWLKRRLSELGEAISDRAGLEAAASRTSYAQLLLEIAALPRPTGLGVAMAQPSRLSHRIERLLNESSFTKAFTASRRALAAVLVAPLVLLASAALVQVHAAVPQQDQTKPTDQQTTVQVEGVRPPAPPAEPGAVPPPADAAMPPIPMPPAPPMAPGSPMRPLPPQGPGMMPPPPPDGAGPGDPMLMMADVNPEIKDRRIVVHMRPPFGMTPNGEPYALVSDERQHMPGFTSEEMEKARKMAHGHFLLFRHGGKAYVVDDAATVAQLEASRASSAELEQRMREAGREQGEKARQMAEQFRQMHVNLQVKVPDLTNEMADVNKALAELKAKQGATISPQDLGELERKLGELQRKLGQAQMAGLEHLNVHIDDAAMKQFEDQMRKMGDQIGKAFHDHDEKVRTTIEESLKNGQARPVE